MNRFSETQKDAVFAELEKLADQLSRLPGKGPDQKRQAKAMLLIDRLEGVLKALGSTL